MVCISFHLSSHFCSCSLSHPSDQKATSSESDFEDIAGISSTISSLYTAERSMPPSPVDPPVDPPASLESPLASSTLSPKSSSNNTGVPPTQFPRHERFWFRDGSVIFVVSFLSFRPLFRLELPLRPVNARNTGEEHVVPPTSLPVRIAFHQVRKDFPT